MKKKTKLIVRILLLIGTLYSLTLVPWKLLWVWIFPLPNTIEEQVEQAVSDGFDGIIVYVDEGGKEPQFHAAGWHNRSEKIPAKPEALFKIASIGKLYVALATTKLVNKNQLDLDKSLAEYFPELVGRIEYAEKISLRMMVQHRSGIPNFTNNPEFWSNPPKNDEEVLAYALDQPAYFKPDAKFGYSNTNYLLITKLIDKTVGYSHLQYITEEILRPNGLDHTYGSMKEIDMDDLMSGYYVGIPEDMKSTNYGSMIASAEDVGKFIRSLNDGSIFDEGEKEIYSSIYEFNHTGLIPGYQSIAKYHSDMDTVVIQFTNTTDFEGDQWGLSEIIYKRILRLLRKSNRP